jgi:hypothetical protein
MTKNKKIRKPTGIYPFAQSNRKGSDARRQRRDYMKKEGILKEAKSLHSTDFNGWREYLKDQIDYGNRLMNDHIEDVMREIKTQLSAVEAHVGESLKDAGFSKTAIKEQQAKFRADNKYLGSYVIQ